MKLLKLFFGYALMSAAWNVSGGDIIILILRFCVWLTGLNMILSVVLWFMEGLVRVKVAFELDKKHDSSQSLEA